MITIQRKQTKLCDIIARHESAKPAALKRLCIIKNLPTENLCHKLVSMLLLFTGQHRFVQASINNS
ncbi:CLUMA_CG013587, isoform A [Clunio marinus]|uniref:CLUMA_CG013587, isoform A n=1 Tax=Clunio marinus TaxID=568069 RepID=A0A1J1IKM4_9DIPT|nr:CLUMA_CG013587, isoform A [Clunio marinus]